VLALLLAGSLFGLSACSDSEETSGFMSMVDPNEQVPAPSSENIADSLRENVDYGTLLTLIEDADLVLELQGDNMGLGWTLFAPSDDAFSTDQFESLSREQQIALVRQHLYSGRVMSADLLPGPLVMSNGATVAVTQNSDGTIAVGGATIIARDRVVSNGVIHYVDAPVMSFP